MPIYLSTSNYSFVPLASVGFYNTECAPVIDTCWPVYSPEDLRFQIIAHVSGSQKSWFEVVDPGTGLKQSIQARICTPGALFDYLQDDLFSYSADWYKVSEGTTDIWHGDFYFNLHNWTSFYQMPPGTCFQLCFHDNKFDPDTPWNNVEANPVALSHSWVCFQRINNICFTSTWEYRNNEDAFGFYYTDELGPTDFYNRIRIPCYLRDIQFPSEERCYKKSDGGYIKLYERIDEEYELNVDWLQKNFHRMIKVMLAHDYTAIDNINDAPGYFTPVVCREKYEINWPDIPWVTAPAKTRLRVAQPFRLLNSNCR